MFHTHYLYFYLVLTVISTTFPHYINTAFSVCDIVLSFIFSKTRPFEHDVPFIRVPKYNQLVVGAVIQVAL